MRETVVAEQPAARLRCGECDDKIEECECCNEPDCPNAVCYECLAVALGQTAPQPHTHGG